MLKVGAIADHGGICRREIQGEALNLSKANAFDVCNRPLSLSVDENPV